MDILTLKQKIPATYFDYQRLKNAISVSGQANKRRYIGQLIKKGYIVRVKKGLYIWGNTLNPAGYAKMILANLLFGPSYVSLEYALSHYGMIPERVETVTSVTFKKNKSFSTPVGHFEFRHLHRDAYAIGVKLLFVQQQETALIAAPEKALLDTIALRVKKSPRKPLLISFCTKTCVLILIYLQNCAEKNCLNMRQRIGLLLSNNS